MTIRFTQSWNGYYTGQVVTSPAGGNSEAQLVSLGYAVYDLDGPSNTPSQGTAAPAAFTTRALTSADNGAVLVCGSSQTATVPPGMATGFGCAFKGTSVFTSGQGVTVTDVRTTGATNPWCALVQTAADVYDIVGTKA